MFSWKLYKIFNNNLSIVTRNVDQVSIGYLITPLYILNFDKIFAFQAVTAGYTKSYHSEKALKVVNNTPAAEISQNCQMICNPYYWDKQHANISPLINDYALLPENVSFFEFLTAPHFVRYFNNSTDITRKHFREIFLNSHKCFQDIFLRCIRDVAQ